MFLVLRGMSVKDAKKTLQELELDLKVNNEPENYDKSKTIIKEQIPKEGIIQEKGGYIMCEIENQ